YSLTGPERAKAIAAGLAGAEWYRAAIPRAEMKALMQRSDMPALRDTLLWILLLVVSGVVAYETWAPGGRSPPSRSTASCLRPAPPRRSTNPSTPPPSAPSG